MEINIETINRDLQALMNRGWSEFKAGKDFEAYQSYAKFLIGAGFLEHPLRRQQPNPANEFAARTIAKYIGEYLQKIEMLYSPVTFPGNFHGSQEVQGVDGGKLDLRTFELPLTHQSGERYKLITAFKHIDDPPDFPEPPTVQFHPVS